MVNKLFLLDTRAEQSNQNQSAGAGTDADARKAWWVRLFIVDLFFVKDQTSRIVYVYHNYLLPGCLV